MHLMPETRLLGPQEGATLPASLMSSKRESFQGGKRKSVITTQIPQPGLLNRAGEDHLSDARYTEAQPPQTSGRDSTQMKHHIPP